MPNTSFCRNEQAFLHEILPINESQKLNIVYLLLGIDNRMEETKNLRANHMRNIFLRINLQTKTFSNICDDHLLVWKMVHNHRNDQFKCSASNSRTKNSHTPMNNRRQQQQNILIIFRLRNDFSASCHVPFGWSIFNLELNHSLQENGPSGGAMHMTLVRWDSNAKMICIQINGRKYSDDLQWKRRKIGDRDESIQSIGTDTFCVLNFSHTFCYFCCCCCCSFV